jgi:hypothetical protein
VIGDAAIKALRDQNTEFGFGQVKPAAVFRGVVPFKALDQAARFRGRERLHRAMPVCGY